MENYNLVRPEHLNQHGYLFGGQMLSWVDECAWMTASREFPEHSFVTRGMDKIEFKHPVNNGSILRFNTEMIKKGETSVTYLVEVYEDNRSLKEDKLVFSTTVTFVSVDMDGNKIRVY